MAKVIDPVCGMEVDSDSALRSEFEVRTYYFCSETCRGVFRANPRELLARQEPPFTTKGFPAPKFGSAGSGGAEYEPGPPSRKPEHKS